MAMIHIKELTRAVDTKKRNWYKDLDEDGQKQFSPWKSMRFASASSNDSMHKLCLDLVNDIVNINFNSFTKHKELLWLLLTCTGTGQAMYHPWIPPGKKGTKNKVLEWFQKTFPQQKVSDLEVLAQICTKAEILEYGEKQGLTDKQLNELKNIFK